MPLTSMMTIPPDAPFVATPESIQCALRERSLVPITMRRGDGLYGPTSYIQVPAGHTVADRLKTSGYALHGVVGGEIRVSM